MAKGIGKHLHFYRGQWRARIVVPPELRPLIGKTQLEEPLGADPKQAEKRSHSVLAGFHDRLDLARAHLEASTPTLASAAKAMFASELDFDLAERGAPRRSELPGATRMYADKLRLVATGFIQGEEAEAYIGYAADDLIQRGLASAPTPVKRAELLKVLAAVRIDSLAVAQSRDKGEAYPPAARTPELLQPDPAPLPPLDPSKRSNTGITLDDLLKRFHEERTETAEKTRKEHEVAIRMLSGFLGKGTNISDIKRGDIIRYKDALKLTPANSQQRFPGMTIVKAAKANAKRKDPYPVLNPATINGKWLMHLNNVFNWAVRNDLIPANPAHGVKVDIGKGSVEPARSAYTLDDIAALFSNPFFTETKEWNSRHWALLLGLYTGGRNSSEFRKTRLDEIYELDGVPVIDLAQASKNQRSKRIIPLHKDLLALGFLDYVKKLKETGEVRLFPDWEPEDKINRWVNRTYLKQCGITDPKKDFYALRKTMKTALARCGVNRDVSDLITGHKDQSVGGIYIGDQAVTMIQSMSEGLNRVDFGMRKHLGRRMK